MGGATEKMRIQEGFTCKWVLIPHDKLDIKFIEEYFPRARKEVYKNLIFYKIEE